jgi:hypothetical protein
MKPNKEFIRTELTKLVRAQHKASRPAPESSNDIFKQFVEPLIHYAEAMRQRNDGEVAVIPFGKNQQEEMSQHFPKRE